MPGLLPAAATKSSTSSLAHRPVKQPSVAPSATANRPAASSAAKASSYSAESWPFARQPKRTRTHGHGGVLISKDRLPALRPNVQEHDHGSQIGVEGEPAGAFRQGGFQDLGPAGASAGGSGLDMLNNRRA